MSLDVDSVALSLNAFIRCAYPNNSFIQPFDDKQPDLVDTSVFFTCEETSTPLEVIQVNHNDGWASVAIANQGALWDIKGNYSCGI